MVEALIQVEAKPDANINQLVQNIRAKQHVTRAMFAIAATIDVVVFAEAPGNSEIVALNTAISSMPEVASTFVQILAG